MDKRNVGRVPDWFGVLQTTERVQTAVMTLQPGAWSGRKGNEHPGSEQVLLVLEGKVVAEIGDQRLVLQPGDVVIVRAGQAHRFGNESEQAAVTFNVYAPRHIRMPPAY
jgi:mannose-6-phosphate isomerase-like protein (cupin superfamily)